MRHLMMLSCGLLACMAFVQTASGQTAPVQTAPPATAPGNDFVKALSFAHHFATPAALKPENDRRLKTALLNALKDKPPTLSFDEVEGIFDKEEFAAWAPNHRLTIEQIDSMLAAAIPESRVEILPETRGHVWLLTTQLDMLDQSHQQAANELARWIAKNYVPNKSLDVTIICTGNSRRSILGATLGNIAADYWGLPNVNFHSGGTAPSAFNSRTIKALEQIGVEVTKTDQEAARGEAGEPNPIYELRWQQSGAVTEFSKLYSDARNPQKGFAAILVCDEADTSCPLVDGASVRISAPYFDPKAYDGTPLEAAKYAERRDDIGRTMLSALMQARRQLHAAKKM